MGGRTKYYLNRKFRLRLPKGNLHLAGFTLLELLIGMAVFAVVAASVYTSLYLGIQVWKQEESSDDVMQEAMITLKTLEKNLRCTFISPENDKLKFIGNTDHISFFSINSVGDLERIGFYLESNEHSESYSLICSRKKYTQLEEEGLPIEEIINTKILTFRLQYFNKNENKWYESWPEELMLPQQVKLEISFARQADKEEPYELVKYINIPMANSIDFSRNEEL